MSPKTFIGADHHFWHKKILEFEGINRPFKTIEEHNEALIDNHNSVVNPRDTFWCLGDFCFSEKGLEIAGRLNGIKKLILGNHDTLATHKYLKYFNKVYGAVKFKGYILTHIPVHESQKYRYKGNIHGHLHSKVILKRTKWDVLNYEDIIDPFYINVSLEQHNLAPVELETLIEL